LLDGAKIPSARKLPDDLRELAQRQGLSVRHASFRADTQRLISELRELVNMPAAAPPSTIQKPPTASPAPSSSGSNDVAAERFRLSATSTMKGAGSAPTVAVRRPLRSTTFCWPASAAPMSRRCASRSPKRSSTRGARSASSIALRKRLPSTMICWLASAAPMSCRCASRSPKRSSTRG
jgi:hypothetical protein